MKSDGCRRWWLRGGGPALEEIPRLWRYWVQAFWNASGMNVYVCWKSTYLSSFLVAPFSAAPPAFADVGWRYESATVSVTVTSHMRLFPRCHGMRVSPSDRFRCATVLAVPERMACLLSLALYVWCRWVDGVIWIGRCPAYTRVRAYLLRQPICHKGTGADHRGWCRDEDPQQLWLPRCRASTRMLTAGERGANHRCRVPILPGAELGCSCLWRPTWRRLGLRLSLVCPQRSASYHLVIPSRAFIASFIAFF